MSSIKHVARTNFSSEVLQARLPVLIDFYADWCGPCRMLAPILERLSAEFVGRAKIVKINVDAEPELASQFRVESIPTLLFVVDGEVVGRTAGLAPEPTFHDLVRRHFRGALKPPFNDRARAEAGLTPGFFKPLMPIGRVP